MGVPWSRAYWRQFLVRRFAAMPDRRGVKFLLRLYDRLYYFMLQVIKLTENGVHPRHRLTDAHAFFLDHVGPGDRVLDVGSGYGYIAASLAAKVKSVTGIEIRPEAVAQARRHSVGENVTFIEGNFLDFATDDTFDVIIAANVLEHIKERQQFLRKSASLANRLLVRVPAVNRDWLVPYRRELGLEWRLNPDHQVEYTEESLKTELEAAGFVVNYCSASYGAILCAAEVKRRGRI